MALPSTMPGARVLLSTVLIEDETSRSGSASNAEGRRRGGDDVPIEEQGGDDGPDCRATSQAQFETST